MVSKKKSNTEMQHMLGHYSFMTGIAIAVLFGLLGQFINAQTASILTLVLVLLGIIVGFLNIIRKEREPFLIAVITLGMGALASYALDPLDVLGVGIGSVSIGALFIAIVNNIAIFVAPAAIIVAIKTIWDLGSTR